MYDGTPQVVNVASGAVCAVLQHSVGCLLLWGVGVFGSSATIFSSPGFDAISDDRGGVGVRSAFGSYPDWGHFPGGGKKALPVC